MDPFQNQNEEIEFGNLSEEDSTSYSLDEEKDKKTTPQKKDKNKVIEKSGVIYISHLPHGFYEVQLYKYFRQFGGVLHVKLARSKKVNIFYNLIIYFSLLDRFKGEKNEKIIFLLEL
eukprot:TRINITY_DN2982_c0_g1_i1.p1 TRINITY_DN2982_c0_g1~~TRINITY_DN2982_c0_g1_i1.p1  ORF type:complete len:117 (-),score=26.62 TRINITY_DN2982_c0_g1_i1:119-469(-)